VLLAGYLDHRGIARWQPTPAHLLVGAGIAVAVVLYAWAFSRLTERQTDRVRRRIEVWLSARSPQQVDRIVDPAETAAAGRGVR